MKSPTIFRVLVMLTATASLGACASLATRESGQGSSTAVRVVAGQSYRIVRADPLVLYERERQELSAKQFVVVIDRFFSTAADAPLHPLTLLELKRAYPDNHKFHDALTLAFANDAELTRWDSFHHEYLVARLLRQSLADPSVVSTR